MNPQPYSFCFLRYVHEPLSGEFANVGVLLWAPGSRFLGFRASRKFARLSHFFHGFQQQDHRLLIGRIDTQFQKLAAELIAPQASLPFPESPGSARELALLVIPHDDAALQWSPSGGGLSDDPERELELLFHEAVSRHYDQAEDARRNDAAIYREIYSPAFESPRVKPLVTEHEVTTPLASHTFPQAWKNGVWNVYQPLSLDLKLSENIKAKAFRWESLTRFLANAPEKPNITLLLAEPESAQRRAYEEARDVLHSSGAVTLIEENEASDFARDMERRISALAEKDH